MYDNTWSKYNKAPLFIKFFSWIAIAGTLFFLFHSVILIAYSATIDPQAWVQEIYFNLFTGLPIFLLFTGKMIGEKKFRIPLWLFLAVFLIGHLINMFNTYEILDVGGLQYPMSVALLGLFITYAIHFVSKSKSILDFLKIAWFACLMWVYIAPRFIQSGHKAGWLLIVAECIFPLLMIIGLIQFYNTKKQNT